MTVEPLMFSAWALGQPLDQYLQHIFDVSKGHPDFRVPLAQAQILLNAFISENFAGSPLPKEETYPTLVPVDQPFNEDRDKLCLDQLQLDGEFASPVLRRPLLLIVAISVVEALPETERIVALWRLRTWFLWQRVLTHRTSTLRRRLETCIQSLSGCLDSSELEALGIPAAQLCLEIGYIYDYFREVEDATKMFLKAKAITGLEISVTGMLGVRTEHQSFKTAQLVVNATSTTTPEPTVEVKGTPIRIIQSEDCNVLQRPCNRNLVFREPDLSPEAAVRNLTVLDQCTLLALCLNIRNNNPDHGLTGYEMLAYLERVLCCTNTPYIVKAMAVSLKAKLEWNRSRVQERGLLQMQEIIDVTLDSGANREERLVYFFAVPYAPVHSQLRDLAKRYLALGMAKTAESLGEQIQDWALVVNCCQRQGNMKRAEHIVNGLLQKEPDNPLHWCVLAEATRCKEHFLTAFEKSKRRLARAMRGIARLCTERAEWEESIQYYDQALALNPLYGANWFTLGHACMITQKWDRALECFTRAVQLDPEEGQAWNNLGTVYLAKGKKREAFMAVGMGLKTMERSWRVRENHFRIGLELGEFQIAMQDVVELLVDKGHQYPVDGTDLLVLIRGLVAEIHKTEEKQKQEDEASSSSTKPLAPLVGNLIAPSMRAPNASGPAHPETAPLIAPSDLRTRVDQFVAKLHGTYTDNGGVYRACTEWFLLTGDKTKAFEFLLKEDRASKLKPWTTNITFFKSILEISDRFVSLAIETGDRALLGQAHRTLLATVKAAEPHYSRSVELTTLMDLVQKIEDFGK